MNRRTKASMEFDVLIPKADRIVKLHAVSKNESITELVTMLVEKGGLLAAEKDNVVSSIISQETIASTGIGEGRAVLYGNVQSLSGVECIIGLSKDGIAWDDAVDGEPVNVVYLLLAKDTTNKEFQEHLRMLPILLRDRELIEYFRELS